MLLSEKYNCQSKKPKMTKNFNKEALKFSFCIIPNVMGSEYKNKTNIMFWAWCNKLRNSIFFFLSSLAFSQCLNKFIFNYKLIYVYMVRRYYNSKIGYNTFHRPQDL